MGSIMCGGSLISGYTVITAAHCLYNNDGTTLTVENVFVFAGDVSYIATEDTIRKGITTITLHPNYNHSSESWLHDIAILQV